MLMMPEEEKKFKRVLAIDGHAGAGKSTVSHIVAEQLSLLHINTGSFYRAITWALLQANIDPEDQEAVEDFVETLSIKSNLTPEGEVIVLIDQQDVMESIRSPEVNDAVSPVSAHPAVRERVNKLLRKIKHPEGLLMEGRDIGTAVFPDAMAKVFLTASVEERAKRRFKDAQDRGDHVTLDEIKNSIMRRDKIDSERKVAPLMLAEDAVLIDTTELSQQDVIDRMMTIWHLRKKDLGY